MTKPEHFIVRWVVGDVAPFDRYLLWCDGGDAGHDRFATDPRTFRPLVARSRKAIVALAHQHHLSLSARAPHTIHLPNMESILVGLRPGRSLSPQRATALLECWNALSDLAHTVDAGVETKRLRTKRLYDKLFYGSNVPSMTPAGQTYRLVLGEDERRTLRAVLRRTRKAIEPYVSA